MLSYYTAVVGSLLLHGLVVVLMLSGWQKNDVQELRPQPNVVQARLIELEAAAPAKTEVVDLTARREQERRAEEARKLAQRKRDEEEKRKLEEQRLKDEALKKEAEKLAEEQREKDEQQRKLDQELEQEQRRIADFEDALKAEEAYQATLQEQTLVASVGYEIERSVESSWSRPPSARRGMQVVLRVSLVPTGGLSSVEILDSSGDPAFDRSATQAVQKAAPFAVVKEIPTGVFESNFRTFQFRFSPQDLRL